MHRHTRTISPESATAPVPRLPAAMTGMRPAAAPRRRPKLRLLLGLAAGLALTGVHAAPADELQPFEASYAWEWHGAAVALSTVTLVHQAADTWVYSSRTEPRGIGRLFSERPTQRSVLRISATGVQPLHYQADDGTRSTKRDADVTFDWDRNHASGIYNDVKVDMPLKPGVQDDLSVQVAMMVQLLRGHTPDGLSVIDKNSVRDYRYARAGMETLDTPLGKVATLIYTSQHAGSPRITRFWCAPSLGYLPVRVQQVRIDSVQWTMDLQSFRRD